MAKHPIGVSFALIIAAPLLSGCVAVAATGLVVGVSAARQERTVGAAIDDVRIKSAVTTALAGESVIRSPMTPQRGQTGPPGQRRFSRCSRALSSSW